MKEIMIKTIKEDSTYMLTELGNMRKAEQEKDLKNILMENSGLSKDSVGYRVYFKDFRPYRKMVDSLSKNYDSLNQLYKYNILKGDEKFVEYIVSSLFIEAGELHKLMETCKEDYDQYRCMSDAYVKLTDKICRIERDMPRKVESETQYNPIIKNKELGLIKYQQDVVEFKGKDAICDWPRNAGKTFTIAKIIELNKPENVLYIDNIGSISSSLDTLCDKFKEINKSNENTGRDTSVEVKVKTSTKLELLVHDRTDYSSEVNVYTLKSLYSGETDRSIVFDYVFFAECLPYNLDAKAEQSISFISYNDKDEWLKRFFPTCKIFKVDYKLLVEVGLLSQKMVDSCKEMNYKKFLNEFAILD